MLARYLITTLCIGTLDTLLLLSKDGKVVATVQRGRAAELLVLSGDPLSSSTRVQAVISGGNLVFNADEAGE